MIKTRCKMTFGHITGLALTAHDDNGIVNGTIAFVK